MVNGRDVLVEADLEVDIERPSGPPVHAHLRGEASRLVLEVDQPGAFAGNEDAPALRGLAEMFAGAGVSIRVEHRGTHLVTLGSVRAPWWHRRVTGSRRIRLGSLRGLLTSGVARARSVESILPSPETAPPTTLRPVFPTFALHSRRPVGTTHDVAGGGAPRLVLAREFTMGDERPPTYWLEEETTIGSAQVCDIALPGLEPHQATVRRTADDEYVVHQDAGSTRVHGAGADGTVLRTGARIELGPHTLVFYREEYADHGRPFGGRVGGEARAPAQPAPAGTGRLTPPRVPRLC